MHFQEKPTRGRGWFLGVSATICASYFIFSFALNAFADPPGSPYAPGSTLNPSCAPTSTNCTVYPPLFSTSTLPIGSVLFVNDASGTITGNTTSLYVDPTTGNVGVSTSSPFSDFSVAGLSPQNSTSTLVLLGNNFIVGGNASGTFLGINAPASYNGDFINLENNSSTLFKIASSGAFDFYENGVTSSNIFASTAPRQDLLHIANASATGVNTSGVNALSIFYVGGAGTGGIEAAAERIDLAPGASGTWSGLRIISQSSTIAGVNENAIKIDPLTSPGGGAETALQIGSGWDMAINILSSPVGQTSTALFMLGSSTQNLPNASGTFIGINTPSSFNGDFLVFQQNSSTEFRVASSGAAYLNSLNIGTTTASSSALFTIGTSTNILSVYKSGTVLIGATSSLNLPSSTQNPLIVCAHTQCIMGSVASNTSAVAWFASNNGLTTGISIGARGQITAGLADVGEYITVKGSDGDYSQGDLLSISNIASDTFQKSDTPYDSSLAGIITTTAGLVAGGGADSHGSNVIALAGRVPVKVTGQNGPIAIGDYITSSDVPGYGMKATQSGRVVGVAMDVFSGTTGNQTGTVLVFVNPHWTTGNATDSASMADIGWNLTNASGTSGASPVDQFTAYVAAALARLGIVIQNGVATLRAIVVDKVTTNLLCVQNVCITGNQLGNLLQNAGTQTVSPPATPPPATPPPAQSSTDPGFVVASDTTTSDVTTTDSIAPNVIDANASGTTN
jgi:hypothetical protein